MQNRITDIMRAMKVIKKDKEIKINPEHFSTPGAFLKMNKGRPNKEDLLKAREFAKKIKASYQE